MSSFYEQLLREAVGELVIEVEGTDFAITYPTADDVAALDELVRPTDILDAMVGEDTADDILDLIDERPISVLNDIIDEIRSHYACLIPPRYGWAKLVEEFDLYGEAIERDLIDLNLNLYDWFRDHENTPWDKLFRILERAPDGGYYNAARLTDVELAQKIAELQDSGELSKGSNRPPVLGWTREKDVMLQLLETLERIEYGLYAASPKFKRATGPKPRRKPRPVFAKDRVERFRLYVEHDDIMSQVLGSRYRRRVTDDDGNVIATPDFVETGEV